MSLNQWLLKLRKEFDKNMEDEIVQYYVINKELNMSPGKIAAQVGHIATMIALEGGRDELPEFHDWYINYDQKKIILKGKQKDLEKLIEQGFYYVRDLGLTEIEAGSLTVVGLYPMWKSEAQKYVKRLQLL